MRYVKRLVAVLVLFALTAPSHASAQTLEKVKLSMPTKNLLMWPFIMAQETGIFKEEGLEVELVVLRSDLVPAALGSGELDYSSNAETVLRAAHKGLPVRSLMSIGGRPALSLIVRPEIASGKDLKGKAIAVSAPGTITAQIARAAARSFGLDPDKDITILGVGDQKTRFQTMSAGSAAGAVLDPPIDVMAISQGFKRLAWGRDLLEIPQLGLATTVKKIAERPDQVQRMVRGTLKGLVYVLKHRNETISSLAKDYKLERPMAEASYEAVLGSFTKDGSISLTSVRNLLLTDGKGDLALEKLVETRFLEQAQRELGLK
jgi:NitT/TauT family transport system substrate-binding protein